MGITLGVALMLSAAVVAWLAHGRINKLNAVVLGEHHIRVEMQATLKRREIDLNTAYQNITALNDRLTRYADELEAVSKAVTSHTHPYAKRDHSHEALDLEIKQLVDLVNRLPRDLMKHVDSHYAPVDHTHPEFTTDPPPAPDPVDIPAIVQAALTTALAPFTPRHRDTDVTASNPGAINLDLTPAERAERDQEQLIAAYDAYDPTDDEFPLGRAYDDYTPPVIPGVEINLPTL